MLSNPGTLLIAHRVSRTKATDTVALLVLDNPELLVLVIRSDSELVDDFVADNFGVNVGGVWCFSIKPSCPLDCRM